MSVPVPWGITNLGFLILFGSLCVLLHMANIVAWRIAQSGAAAGDDPPAVDVYELALLNGGPRQAITTALTMLDRRGVLRSGSSALSVEGELDGDADPLERAVYDDLRRRGRLDSAALREEPTTAAALEQIRVEVTGGGLLIDPRRTAWTRRLWLGGPFVLLALGVVRLIATWDYDDVDVRILSVVTVGVAAVAVSHAYDDWRFDRRPLRTALGDSLVDRWRNEDPAMIEAEDERIALLAALRDEQEWDPGRVLARAAPSGAGEPLPHPASELRQTPADDAPGDDGLLIAEELVVLGSASPREQSPRPTLGVQLVAVLLVELGLRGRIAVQTAPGGSDETVVVLDNTPTGDELLDDALALVDGTGTPAEPEAPSERLWGTAARRRLRTRGRVSDRDVVSWWWGSWRCAEFPELAPTVVQRLLMLYEGMRPIEDRVARRLVDRGALRALFAGPWPNALTDHALLERLRHRALIAAVGAAGERDPRADSLLAIGATNSDWLSDVFIGSECSKLRVSALPAARRRDQASHHADRPQALRGNGSGVIADAPPPGTVRPALRPAARTRDIRDRSATNAVTIVLGRAAYETRVLTAAVTQLIRVLTTGPAGRARSCVAGCVPSPRCNGLRPPGVTPVVRSGACESSMRPRRWASEDDHDEAHQAHSRAGHPQVA